MLKIQFMYFIDTSKLLNTVLKYKIINTQFEVDLKLACIDADDSESLPNYLTQEDKKKQGMPIDSLILQSTHLEDSNFKNQFFVTRCSFQVKTFSFYVRNILYLYCILLIFSLYVLI